MPDRNIVSREAWLEARIAHLEREKEFTRLRDELRQSKSPLLFGGVGPGSCVSRSNCKEGLHFYGRSTEFWCRKVSGFMGDNIGRQEAAYSYMRIMYTRANLRIRLFSFAISALFHSSTLQTVKDH